MPIKKGSKRTWAAGRPRLEGEPVQFNIILTQDQLAFLKAHGNVSEQIRKLIDRARKKAAKT